MKTKISVKSLSVNVMQKLLSHWLKKLKFLDVPQRIQDVQTHDFGIEKELYNNNIRGK